MIILEGIEDNEDKMQIDATLSTTNSWKYKRYRTKCTDKSNGLHFCTGIVCVFNFLVRLNIDLIFFSKWWAREIRCRMLHSEPIPLPIIQECFEHWCTVQNVLILWDGGSSC